MSTHTHIAIKMDELFPSFFYMHRIVDLLIFTVKYLIFSISKYLNISIFNKFVR